MARPREFDFDAALEKAMQVFWSKGFEATSLDDLCDVTGLSRSSLYSAFGDKRNILFQSLKRYSEQGSERIAKVLARKRPFRAALADLVDEFIAAIVAGPGRRGCFIGNCAAELARHDPEAMRQTRAALQRNEGYFYDALVAARARGEIAATTDLRALARFITSSLQGLRLIGKVNPDRAALEEIAAVMLRCVEQESTK